MNILQTYNFEFIETNTEELNEYLDGLQKGHETASELFKNRRLNLFNSFEAFNVDFPRGGLSFAFFYGYIDGYEHLKNLWRILNM